MTCPGPCVYCGATNYSLSMGGPTICPSCDCGNFGPVKVQEQGKTITTLSTEKEALQLENMRLAAQVLKAQELMQALTAALNLNDAMMTELVRLGQETKRPIPIELVLSKHSFDERMKKLFGR